MNNTDQSEETKLRIMKEDLLKHKILRIDSKHAMNYWQHAVASLEQQGVAETKMIEVDEQYSYLQIRLNE